MKISISKKNTVLLLVLFAIMFPIDSAHGADVRFKQASQAEVGGELIVEMTLDPGDEAINAFQGELSYNPSALEYEGYSDGDSVISLWVQKPELNISTGRIEFAGIIPGGLSSLLNPEGSVASFIFEPITPGTTFLDLDQPHVYLHGPDGVETDVNVYRIALPISPSSGRDIGPTIILDFYAPEQFDVEIVSDENIYDGDHVAIFNTQDKGSGIARYEIRERLFGVWGSWKLGESPYRLEHQSLFITIEVLATDNVGHSTSASVVPDRMIYLIILVALLFGVIIVAYFTHMLAHLFHRKKKHHRR